jgi:cysteinyl-tRNA synthetase
MTLKLTNTLTRRVEEFRPIEPGKVSIYCCGVTVYDLCHLGHARSYIAWDVLRRYLIWSGYAVTFVQNYTDIDDKILNRAAEEGSSMEAVSERNIDAFVADMARLNILPADRMPRATRSLDAIRALISELEAKGAAYSADGDVYFAVMKHAGYGKLSGRDLEQQQDNAAGRVTSEEEARKQHPFDFALWKGTKPGEPSFPSPWGAGRPGWHIECSAMVREELGDTIDIHLGGADLVSPPRKRDRPVGSGHRQGAGPLLAAQRNGERGRPEDEQIARQLHHHPRPAGFRRLADDPAPVHPAGPLPQTARLHRRRPRRRGHRLERPQRRPGPGRRNRGRRS